MADLSKTIQIVFEAVDNTGTGISALSKGVGDLAGNLESATAPFADLTQKILAFDAVVVGLAATLGKAAIGETAQFEESLYLVKKQLDDLDPSLEEVRLAIQDVGLAYGVNANEVAKSTAAFMAAGYDYKTAAELVKSSTNLMIAGELGAAEATTAITASLAGFKVPAVDAAAAAVHIGDVLNKIGDISSGAFDQIVDGFKQIAPTAKDAGWSMEQTAAAIATIVDTGYSGSEAANALKSGLVQLVDPPKDAREALKGLDVALVDSNGTQRLAGDIMADLAGKYQGLTQEQKLQTSAVIFGKDQAGKLNALLGDWGKNQGYVAQMLDETTGAVGSMAKEVQGKMDTLQTAINKTNEAWRQFLENLGAKIVEGGDFKTLTENLGKLGVAFRDVIQAGDLDPLIKPFQDAFEVIGQLFADMAENLPAALEKIDWSKFEDAVASLGDSFGSIFEGIDLSTPEGLAKVIQDILDLGAGLIKTTSGIVDGLKPLFQIIGSIVDGFASLDPEVQKAIGYFLGISTTVNTLSGYVKGFADLIGAGGGLLKSLTAMGPVLAAVGVAFAAFEFGKWAGEVTGYNDAADKLIAKLNGVPDAAEPAADAIGRIPENLKAVSESTGLAISSMEDFNRAADRGEIIFDNVANTWIKGSDALTQVEASTGLVIGSLREFNDLADRGKIVWDETSQTWITAAEASRRVGEEWAKLVEIGGNLNPALKAQYEAMGLAADGTKKLGDATKDSGRNVEYFQAILKTTEAAFKSGKMSQEEYTAATTAIQEEAKKSGISLDKLTKSEEDAAKKTKDLAAESEKFALEWEKLLSAERIAVFQASADIQVAQIEADSKRAVAAMEMLSASFANTGDVLTELIGLWAGLEGMDQSKIEAWIEREYAIREKLAQAQIDLVNAEIRRLEAQSRLLEKGGVELKITSDGLEPELEAFMFRVIDKVRVSVAGSYEEFLLGCGS